MGYKRKKWPSYALEALENTLANLDEITDLSREAQEATTDSNRLMTVILLGDIREKAQAAKAELTRARTGEYA